MTKLMNFLRNLFGLEKPEEEKQENTSPQKTANPAPIVRAPFVPKKFDPGATMMVRDMRPYQPEEPAKKDANQAENKSALG